MLVSARLRWPRARTVRPLAAAAIAALITVALLPLTTNAASPSGDLLLFQKTSGPWQLTDVSSLVGGITTSTATRSVPFKDPDGNLDVFAADPSGHLLKFSQPLGGGGWQVLDLTAAVGGTTITSEPSPIQVGSGVQVYAIGGDGNEQSFNRDQPGGQWQVFLASSGQALRGNPQAVFDGTNVHVYSQRSDGHLLEMFKPPATGWQLFDLTASVSGVAGLNPTPILYSGNSVQALAVDTNGHLWDYVEPFAGPSQEIGAFDETANAGATSPFANPKPILFPEGGSTLEVFGPGRLANGLDSDLGNFQKTPTANWEFFDTTSNSTPNRFGIDSNGIAAPLANGSDIHVYGTAQFNLTCHLRVYSGFLRLIEWFKTPSVANWQTFDIGAAAGRQNFSTLSDPASIFFDSSGILDVFATGT